MRNLYSITATYGEKCFSPKNWHAIITFPQTSYIASCFLFTWVNVACLLRVFPYLTLYSWFTQVRERLFKLTCSFFSPPAVESFSFDERKQGFTTTARINVFFWATWTLIYNCKKKTSFWFHVCFIHINILAEIEQTHLWLVEVNCRQINWMSKCTKLQMTALWDVWKQFLNPAQCCSLPVILAGSLPLEWSGTDVEG